ncbi:predicted protein [Sclerotinia sclerotiorum 1980 UF-70]|uniref:Uncharacterized protein n=1 Tax=Sclerotinia sclerotiorum (strain ATCC 18683 / 1980 / Ss-1) TaxID=665079 RepID=A7F5G0_SCLS1|nr:predicted protein [Sclerotinia sclerotiorum 1980 UF-70]EDN97981.1 predicted protein [Sclerotinia sclerotiorum 1980 UF-70]
MREERKGKLEVVNKVTIHTVSASNGVRDEKFNLQDVEIKAKINSSILSNDQ